MFRAQAIALRRVSQAPARRAAQARVVAQSLLHPVDVVRTRKQAVDVEVLYDARTLGRGLVPQVFLSAPAGAVQFSTLEAVKGFLSERALPPTLVDLVAGAIGATCAAVVRIPQELIKQGCQAGLYDDWLEAARHIWRLGGARGFYRGSASTLTRDIPWNALSYLFFQMQRTALSQFRATGAREELVLGALAGCLAAFITHPIDVVKTRIMTQKLGGDAHKYTGIAQTFACLVREEGPLALSAGLLPRLVYLAPLASLVLATYEAVLRWLVELRARRAQGEAS